MQSARKVLVVIFWVLVVIVVGYWVAGGLWMAALGVSMLSAVRSSNPDPIGVLATFFMFALFCLPLVFAFVAVALLTIYAKRKLERK
jgi:H+/Cl- antiporter ClcA